MSFKLQIQEHSDWKCYMFGNRPGGTGIVYTPSKGNEPNWFARQMMWVFFDCLWVKEKNMTPTNELRWIIRYESVSDDIAREVRCLQQKWEHVLYRGEPDQQTEIKWRDVPTVKEEL